MKQQKRIAELEKRDDVDNADIADIIHRAELLRLEEENRKRQRTSVEEVVKVGAELDIPPEFVEQAIAELRAKREPKKPEVPPKKTTKADIVVPSRERQFSSTELLVVVGGILCLVWVLRPKQEVHVPYEQVNIQNITISSSAPGPISTEKEPKQPKIQHEQQEILPPKTPIVSNKQKDTDFIFIEEDNTKPTVDIVKTTDTVQQVVVETVVEEKHQPKTVISVDPSLTAPVSIHGLEGLWILDGYRLYDKKADQWYAVPVTQKPLDIQKSLEISHSQWKRVLDAELSFTGRVATHKKIEGLWKENFLDGPTQSFLLVVNGVSSNMGIHREHDYFHVELSKDQLVLWYLGANLNKAQVPSQCEIYRKQ